MKGAYVDGGVQLKTINNAVVEINCVLHTGTVISGNNMMGHNVSIFSQNHKYNSQTHSFSGYTEVLPVVIGEYSWIGQGVTILPGVKVGDHSIIGTGAVVAKDVPAGTMVAGNPAVVKRSLMSTTMQRKKINYERLRLSGSRLRPCTARFLRTRQRHTARACW